MSVMISATGRSPISSSRSGESSRSSSSACRLSAVSSSSVVRWITSSTARRMRLRAAMRGRRAGAGCPSCSSIIMLRRMERVIRS
jgi:hypothetical protein